MKLNTESGEFLKRMKSLDAAIKTGIDEVNRLRSLAEKVNVTYSDMPRGGSTSLSKIEDAVINIVALSEDIEADIQRMVNMKRQANEIIKSVENMDYQVVLRMKYICNKTSTAIAEEIKCTEKWVNELHGRALREFDREFKKYFEKTS